MCPGFDCFSTNHGCSISGLNSLLAGPAPKSLVCSAMAPKNQGQEPAAPKTASKGEGMDPTAVSRMLGLLKYRSDPDKNKKGQDMEEAKIGLEVYSTLTSTEKKRFLDEFELSGRGKRKGSLGFALSYKKSISDTHTHTRELSSVEDFYTMPQILDFNGLRWGDYDEKEAVVIAKQLIADNKQEFGHSEKDKIQPKLHILSKFFYVKSGGMTKRRKIEKIEMITNETETEKEIVKLGMEGKLSIENDDTTGASSSTDVKSNVKEEVPGKTSFLNKIGLLRAALLQLNKLSSSGGALQAKFAVAARADTALTAKHKDLEKAMGALNKFKDGVQLKIAELEFLPLELENKEEIKKELVAMDKLLVEADHHAGGCKEMQKRFQPMLGK